MITMRLLPLLFGWQQCQYNRRLGVFAGGSVVASQNLGKSFFFFFFEVGCWEDVIRYCMHVCSCVDGDSDHPPGSKAAGPRHNETAVVTAEMTAACCANAARSIDISVGPDHSNSWRRCDNSVAVATWCMMTPFRRSRRCRLWRAAGPSSHTHA